MIQRKEHKDMQSESKAMIIASAVLMIAGIYKWIAIATLITAVVYEEGVKRW